jgi:hypothetical protein
VRYLTAALALWIPASAESLHYTINWQSGLSLGEAALHSTQSDSGLWSFELLLDAAVPGFTIRDEYRSRATAQLCSETLERIVRRGQRRSQETVTFDPEARRVRRVTEGGGSSEMEAPSCAHDAMAFLQFLRQELAQGRLAANQSVFLGARYDLQLSVAGSETVRQGEARLEADRVRIGIRGPKAELAVEVLFARDAARTPVLARLPLALGTFTVELLP